MKSRRMLGIMVLALGLMVCFAQVSQAAPMGTAFTYQSRLMDKNQPAEGSYDFQFKLYDSNDPCTGTQLASPIDINDVEVIDGHFVVELDFGSGIFDGNAVWLETKVVKSPMGSNPATLSPLLELTPTPYALHTRGIFVDEAGKVGIGTTEPGTKLHVESGDAKAVFGENTASGGIGVEGQARNFSGGGVGVYGKSYSTDGIGVFGIAAMSTGKNYGIYGQSQSPDGWAGYFHGRGHFSGNVGIGTSDPMARARLFVQMLSGTPTLWQREPGFVIRVGAYNSGIPLHVQDSSGDSRFIVSSTGAVGIGMENPTRDLHIYRDAGPAQVGIVTADASSKAQVIFGDGGGNKWTISSDNTDNNKLHFRSGHASGTPRATFQQNGYVGIGTTSPGGILEVSHDGSSHDLVVNESTGNIGIGLDDPAACLHIEQGGSGSGDLLRVTTWGTGRPGAFTIVNPNNNNPALYVHSTSNNAPALRVAGRASVSVLEVTGADIAEKFPVSEKAKPGMVLAIDPEHPGQLCLSRGAYNRCVAGVVSGANNLPAGAILGNLPQQQDAMPIALTGRVWVHCDATQHPIEPGDLLTTAERAGYAMAVTDYQRAQGAVIGKAMTRLKNGTVGLVLTLVNLQ